MSQHQDIEADEICRLNKATRLNRLAEIGRDHGFFRRLSAQTSALFVEEGDTLVVSFDLIENLHEPNASGLPVGFSLVERDEYSLLSFLAPKSSWFRDGGLFRFFDELVDEGFFDQFEKVLFLGLGPVCGYAALSFSVAAPGCHVLATSPVATLCRDQAPFERRFRAAWRMDFQSRYGFAPDMIEAAGSVTILYDPSDVMSAAHAALFHDPHVTLFKLRHGGAGIAKMLLASGGLWTLARAAMAEGIDSATLAQVTRAARRSYPNYISQLGIAADQHGHRRGALGAALYGKNLVGDGRFDQAIALLRQGQS